MKPFSTILILLLAACAAGAQTRPASVNVAALLPRHPLYSTLAQYDRQITVLQSTLHTGFADTGARIDNAAAAVRRELDAASAATSRYQTADRFDFAAMRALSGASQGPAPQAGDIEAGLRQTYGEQQAGVRQTAQRDMAGFRAALLRQQQAAYAAFVASVNARTRRGYNARAQELREKESALLLDLAKRDAPQRLLLRAKLQTLALSGPARSQLQRQLAAIENREDAQAASLRRTDSRILGSYGAQLRARGERDVATMRTELDRRTNDNLAARQRVFAAQTAAGASGLHLPASTAQAPPAGSAAEMQSQYRALVGTPQPDTSAFATARDDLTRRLGSLRQTDASDTQSVRSQIASLEHDREAVRKRMVAQIMQQAQIEAKRLGFSQVYAASQAPAGSADITSSVAADLRSLSPP